MGEHPFELDYIQKIRDIAPHSLVGLWPQFEKQGNISQELSQRAADGTYTGTTLGESAPGDWYGYSSGLYDGVNDFDNIWSATFRDAFDPLLGTMSIWVRARIAGVWTDGVARVFFRLANNATNYFRMWSDGAGNLYWQNAAGGLTRQVIRAGMNTADWLLLTMTWNKAQNRMRAYYNDAQEGVDQGIPGVWAGQLTNGNTVIGAQSTVPSAVWDGLCWMGMVWRAELALPDIRLLSVRQ